MKSVIGDVREGVPRNVNKIEFAFHVFGHVAYIACQFFPDIFFERCSMPLAHFLDLRVQVPGERQSVGSPTAEGVRVDSCDWNPLGCGI